jgi:hypothetical protein
LTLMLFFLLVTLQLPKSPPPDALDEDELLDPHPAMETASASAMASVDIRFRCMERSLSFRRGELDAKMPVHAGSRSDPAESRTCSRKESTRGTRPP